LEIPVSFFVAGGYGAYRKPKTAMWDLYLQLTGLTPLRGSTFVGDSAGRQGDYSDSDRKFALNASIRFMTPEDYFEESNVQEALDPLLNDPQQWLVPKTTQNKVTLPEVNGPGVILMCGPPGSGKSTWVSANIDEDVCTVVSQDVVKTKAKCLTLVKQCLGQGRSVLVDNTNRDVKTRADYIKIARSFKVPIQCVHMNTSRELAEHLNAMRVDHPETSKPRVPPVGERSFYSKYELPTVEEGFKHVHHVDFTFDAKVTPPNLFLKWHV
jgi:bifunctional polynucleotide phosphatase/kinase